MPQLFSNDADRHHLMGANTKIQNCSSVQNQSMSIYEFTKETCTKLTGGESISAAAIAMNRNEMAAGLATRTWMIFESSEPDVQSLWLGRAVAKTEWDNQCTLKNESNRIHRADGRVQVPLRGYAINVQWYTQREVGSLEYIIEKESPLPIVQTNYNLILAGFEMDLVVGTRTRVPRTRNVRDEYDYGYSVARMNLQTREGDWFRRYFGNVYKMNETVKSVGLSKIGLWSR